jgi:hypothetical protein
MPQLKGSLLRDWQRAAGTQLFLADLKEMEQEHKDKWAQRGYEKSDAHEWVVANSMVLGGMAMLDHIIGFLENTNEPTESVGTDADGGQDTGEAS